MKKKVLGIMLLVVGLSFAAQAADILSRNVIGDLSTTNVWNPYVVPTSSDVAVFGTTGVSSSTNALGADVSWQGIRLSNILARRIIINGTTPTITLGTAGIDMSLSSYDLTINPKVALGASQTWSVSNSRTLTVNGVVSGSSGNDLTKAGSGSLVLAGDNTYSGTTTISGGKLQVGTGGLTGSLAGNIVNNGQLFYNRSGAFTNRNVISGSGSLGLTEGTMIITNANTYSGGTSIDGGTVKLGDVNGLGTGAITFNGGDYNPNSNMQDGNGGKGITNSIIIAKTTAMNMLSQKTLFSGQWSGTNAINVNGFAAGWLILTGDNSAFSGPVNMIAAQSLVAGHNSALGTGNVAFNTGLKNQAVFRTTKDLAIANNMNVGASGTNSLTISVTNTLTLSGVLSGAASVIKSGASVLTLTGANTYTNTTAVSAGKLVVDGSLDSALITVGSGATLGGTGTVQAVTIAAGGILAAGNSPGTMTFDGDLILDAGSTNIMEIFVEGFDVLKGSLTNTITMAGYNLFDFTDNTVTNGSSFAVLQDWKWDSSSTNGATFGFTGLASGQSLDYSKLVSEGLVTVIPEPATIGMLGLGAIITMMIRRVRTR